LSFCPFCGRKVQHNGAVGTELPDVTEAARVAEKGSANRSGTKPTNLHAQPDSGEAAVHPVPASSPPAARTACSGKDSESLASRSEASVKSHLPTSEASDTQPTSKKEGYNTPVQESCGKSDSSDEYADAHSDIASSERDSTSQSSDTPRPTPTGPGASDSGKQAGNKMTEDNRKIRQEEHKIQTKKAG
jgi:hypothetical protein